MSFGVLRQLLALNMSYRTVVNPVKKQSYSTFVR